MCGGVCVWGCVPFLLFLKLHHVVFVASQTRTVTLASEVHGQRDKPAPPGLVLPPMFTVP